MGDSSETRSANNISRLEVVRIEIAIHNVGLILNVLNQTQKHWPSDSDANCTFLGYLQWYAVAAGIVRLRTWHSVSVAARKQSRHQCRSGQRAMRVVACSLGMFLIGLRVNTACLSSLRSHRQANLCLRVCVPAPSSTSYLRSGPVCWTAVPRARHSTPATSNATARCTKPSSAMCSSIWHVSCPTGCSCFSRRIRQCRYRMNQFLIITSSSFLTKPCKPTVALLVFAMVLLE